MYERDQVFGARTNAYKVKWTGASVATPDFEENEMDNAAAWALQSAQCTSTATVTILIMPAYTTKACNPAYMRRIHANPHYCKHLITIPRNSFTFAPPDTFPELLHAAGLPNTSKWDMNIIAVGNQRGFEEYTPYLAT